jgi:preprotein translocase subunit SecY
MKRFIQTIKNIFAIEELRTRILNTIGFLVIFRLASFIVLPGINPGSLNAEAANNGILGFINAFSGGAWNNLSIVGLGIMPYITASIILQLLTFAVPAFQKMQKEGDSGRKKINQYTRILTILVTIAQAVGYLAITAKAEQYYTGMDTAFMDAVRITTLVGGTIFCMWLGERITDKGIGNGISMLIMIGIVSRLPEAFLGELELRGMRQLLIFIMELTVLGFIVALVVMVNQATRKIALQYAKQVAGASVYGQAATQRSFLPLKVITAGVMPIIFAQAIMYLPPMLSGYFQDQSDLAANMYQMFQPFTWQYNLVFALLIIVFTFFYTALVVNPNQIADDLKRNGGFVPGVKPGKPTSDYIDTVLSRITLPGALFLALIAILPAFASAATISQGFASFFGGTSLLIMVGVVLDTLQQIESYLLNRHYDGMLKSGKVKGRASIPVA